MRLLWSLVSVALVMGALAGALAPAVAAAPKPKAVIIVGPSGLDKANKEDARRIARQASAAGMRVVSIITPKATWKRVVPALQGASLVVYLGHGNGNPGPNGSGDDTHNGFGLNPRTGVRSPVDYQGADALRKKVRLATNAVVLLYHLCYASGNGEEYMGPEFRKSVAVPRVDNFAAGFLGIGARAVFAYGTDQDVNLPKALMRTDDTMDRIFMSRSGTALQAYDGFVGRRDYYRDSNRVGWARLHLDPHPKRGHYRALTGDLTMRAADFRAGAGTVYEPPPPDRTPPELAIRRSDGSDIAGATLTITPNGDHTGDSLRVRRTLSENARLRLEVRTRSGRVVRAINRDADRGKGTLAWDGRDDDGHVVRDGHYEVVVAARDKAGNRSDSQRFEVVVLTAIRTVSRSASALHAADRDKRARSVRFGYALARRAKVRIEVRDPQGQVVRSRPARTQQQGTRDWVWDGRDQSGSFVPSGSYEVAIIATTGVGTMRVERSVFVGPYRIGVSDGTPARGQRLRITVDATERQRGAPTLVITQAGGSERHVRTRKDAHGDYVATVRLRAGGDAGTLRIEAVGRDDRGNRETQARELALH
ncbi:MAG: FlgD immunoglobulin-like domain containing protein [Chloroflexota bacterium]